jgi:hypothetical protein
LGLCSGWMVMVLKLDPHPNPLPRGEGGRRGGRKRE